MTPNNNLSILPFYDSVDKQNHRKDYAQGVIFPLITPDKKILPFQIIREHSTRTITGVVLRSPDGSIFADITTSMVETGLVVIPFTNYDIIQYPGTLPLNVDTPEGQYYLQIADQGQIWYSEFFNIIRDVSQCMKIAYWDNENFVFENGSGLIDYTNSFKWNVYLPTQVGRPEYPFEEQVESRDGYTFVEKQVSEKVYKFNFLAPEYLLDALRLVRMSDNIQITSKGETYTVDQFLITPKWEAGGYLASVEAEFQCDTVLKKIGKGFVPVDNGDFNNSFNESYDNQ